MPSQDDLLQPSLQRHEAVARAPEKRPWRLRSQFYVALFGGMVAVTGLAFLNGLRLRMSRSRAYRLLLVGLAATVAAAVISALLAQPYLDLPRAERADVMRWMRLGSRALALALCGVLYKMQLPADRLYAINAPGSDDRLYASLWGPGLLAALLGSLVYGGLLAAALALL